MRERIMPGVFTISPDVKFTHESYGMGFELNINDEESVWLRKINRHALWFRYAPKHVQENPLILMSYQVCKCHEESKKSRFFSGLF